MSRVFGLATALAAAVVGLVLSSGRAAAQEADGAPAARQAPAGSRWGLPEWPGEPTTTRWRVGAYVGQHSRSRLVNIIFRPWATKLDSDYIVDAHAIYTAYSFKRVPLDLEIEGGVAQRFGPDHQTEFDLIPMARWKWLPWNRLVYTNVRLGLLGASYTTGVAPGEVAHSGSTSGSRYLNFLVPEMTFAPGPDSPWEAFVRIHHRSGIYGLIDGSKGASSYPAVGVRFAIR